MFITLVVYATIRVIAEKVEKPSEKTPVVLEEKTVNVSLNGKEFALNIADTTEARAKGLSGHESLCDICGIIFFFF